LKKCVQLALLTDYIGQEAALKAARILGGSTFRVPARARGKSWLLLAEALGETAARAMVENYSGEQVYIARNAREEQRLNHAEVIRRLEAGETVAEVARSFNYQARYSDRWIRKIHEKSRQARQTGFDW